MTEPTIIERLRYEECDGECIQPCHIHAKVRQDAAAEIERLQALCVELVQNKGRGNICETIPPGRFVTPTYSCRIHDRPFENGTCPACAST